MHRLDGLRRRVLLGFVLSVVTSANATAAEPVVDHVLRARTGLKPFEYTEAKLPNYLANRRWGVQGDPLNRMQLPVAPAESMKHMVLPEGFEIRLFASEPDIKKPITMAWDERGRLWIAETRDYPNEKRPDEEGRDRITICEDTDGDGRADRFTVFADHLSIPTSLVFTAGGVVVHHAPETLFLADTDGDDRADVRRVLFRGWGTRDTHAGPSNMHWGFDNWIWGIVGYSGFRGTVGGDDHEFHTGFYRFKPDGSRIEFVRSTDNNSWGLSFSEDGLLFGSTANRNPSVYMPIPNRYYERVKGWSAGRLEPAAVSSRFFPITDKVRQVDHHGHFTAGAGHAVYTARQFPKAYWNRTAFVNGPTGHLTATFVLERRGSDVITRNAWNILASDDEWTAPTMAEVGPDGALWVIDWYNYIVQHNPTPRGFRTGKGNAYETDLRDKTHGRIYRIVHSAAKPYTPIRLSPNRPKQLVETLRNDNLFWRMHAQRLLVERGERDVVPALIRLARSEAVDEIGLNPGAIHALWTMHGLGALDGSDSRALDAAIAALDHPSGAVRRAAVMVLPHRDASVRSIIDAQLLADDDAQVRLAAFLALADMPPNNDAGAAIAAALSDPHNADDRWIPHAATSAAAVNDLAFLRSVAAGAVKASPGSSVEEVVGRVAEHYARGGPTESVGTLFTALAEGDSALVEAMVAGLARGWPEDRPASPGAAVEAAMVTVLGRLSSATKGPLVMLANRWEARSFEQYTVQIAAELLTTVQDANQPEPSRLAAARQLVTFRPQDAAVVDQLLGLINPRLTPTLSAGLLDALGTSESPHVGPAVVSAYVGLTPMAKRQALSLLTRRTAWTQVMLSAAERHEVELDLLALDQKQALAAHPVEAIAQRAQVLLARGGGLPSPDRAAVLDQLMPLAKQSGDPVRGKVVFAEQCAKCHVHGGEGTAVGPDLTGMAVHSKEELLTQILDPSRSVEGNYRQYSVITDDGRVLFGLLAAESKTTIELYDAEGKKHVILRETIDRIAASSKSLMPEGFEKQVPTEDLVNLLAFLTQRGRYLPLPLDKVATIVTTRGMFNDENASVERLIFPDWSPKMFNGVPFQLVDPQGDRVPNAILLHSRQGTIPPRMPRSVRLACNSRAVAIHLLSGVSGWGAQGQVRPTVSMIVRLHYADGQTEDHPLRNGQHFADYIRRFDVPDSTFAFQLRGQQLRYLVIRPRLTETIRDIEFVKGRDRTAPLVMAVTVERPS